MPAQLRVTEPFLKAHVGLWLVGRGATELTISVDGQEPTPVDIAQVLRSTGYSRSAPRRAPAWTGAYTRAGGTEIQVVSRPGPDIKATLGKRRLIGECKGEPTPLGVRAGTDRTAFYNALGQLIVAAGGSRPLPDILLLAFPDTPRFDGFAKTLLTNRLLASCGVEIVLVDAAGAVRTA